MPQTKTHKKHRVPFYRRPIVIIIFLLLIILLAIVFVWVMQDSKIPEPENNPDPVAPVVDEEMIVEELESGEADVPPDKVTQFEGDNPNSLQVLTGSLSRRTLDVTSRRIIISAVVDQYLTSGSCILHLIDDSGREVYQASTPIEAEAASSICGLFSVSYENFTNGTYDIRITIESGGRTGIIEDQITI